MEIVAMQKRINVELSGEDLNFLKWLAKRDNVSMQEEMQMIFRTELEELKVYMAENGEWKGE